MVFLGLLVVYRDISLVLLGAVAVVLITGSHTIQQRNVNPEPCCSWTCRNTIESFSDLFFFVFKFFTWLLWNRRSCTWKTFLSISQMCFCFIFHLREDITIVIWQLLRNYSEVCYPHRTMHRNSTFMPTWQNIRNISCGEPLKSWCFEANLG